MVWRPARRAASPAEHRQDVWGQRRCSVARHFSEFLPPQNPQADNPSQMREEAVELVGRIAVHSTKPSQSASIDGRSSPRRCERTEAPTGIEKGGHIGAIAFLCREAVEATRGSLLLIVKMSLDEDTARAAAHAFTRFDLGSKGYLTRHELRCAHVALLGHPPSLVRASKSLSQNRTTYCSQNSHFPAHRSSLTYCCPSNATLTPPAPHRWASRSYN